MLRTPEKDGTFFDSLASGRSVAGSARHAGYSRSIVYLWRDQDPSFRATWEAAVEAGTDRLEDEAWRRAHDGVDKPVFHNGTQVGAVREHSDTLTIFLLKARRPGKFRENRALEITGKDGGPLEVRDQSALEFAKRVAFLLASARDAEQADDPLLIEAQAMDDESDASDSP